MLVESGLTKNEADDNCK